MAIETASPAASAPASRNETMTVAALTGTAVMMTTALLLPSPLLVELSRSFDVPVSVAGQLTTIAAIPWGFGGLIMGPLSDRFGRHRMLLAGVALQCIGTLLSIFAWDFTSMLAFRFIAGCGGACTGPNVMALIGDAVPESRRGKALAWVSMGFSISTLLTLPAAALLGGIGGWRLAFGVVACVAAVAWVALARSLPSHVGAPGASGGGGGFAGYGAVFRRPAVLSLLLANVFERALYAGLTVYLPAFLIQTYFLTTAQTAPVLPGVAIGAMAGTMAGGRFADRYNPRLMYAAVQLLGGAAVWAVYVGAPGLAAVLAATAVFGILNSAGRPSYMLMVSRSSGAAPGAVFGLFSMTNQLGIVVGAAAGGVAIAAGGYPMLGVLAVVSGLLACVLGGVFSPKPQR